MEPVQENSHYYASPVQREVLLNLILYPDIEKSFFLTGGTALTVFYLQHRFSQDIDLFTLDNFALGEIDHWIKTVWPHENIKIKESPNFLSLLIRGIKIDFVIDPLSNKESRYHASFENGHFLTVDTMKNISSNKLCTLVSRTEPKDFIDFYFILKKLPASALYDIYLNALAKDAIFDDPATAAFQLEEGLNFIKKNDTLIPQLTIPLNKKEFFRFFEEVAQWLYSQMKP